MESRLVVLYFLLELILFIFAIPMSCCLKISCIRLSDVDSRVLLLFELKYLNYYN